MASLVDLFSPTFLMFLGILLLVVALIVVYFESRMREQNHKIASMLSLVSTLAEDVNGIKIGLNHLAMNMSGGTIHKPLEQSKEDSKLIEVSDDEKSDTDSDDSDDDDEADDEKSSIDEYEYTDKTDYLDKVLDDAENDVKVFKLNISNEDDELDFEENNCLEELEVQSSDAESISSKKSKLSSSFVKNILSLQYDETSDNDDDDDDEKKNDYEKKNDDEQEIIISSSDLKTININLEDSQQENVDYKKLQLPRLRGIVVEKGITSTLDATKLKKPELLKLLGVE